MLENTLSWLRRLVAYDTTSVNSNLELINTIESFLTEHGLDVALSFNSARTKANIFATLPTAFGNTNGGILLSGHTDTVPVMGQDWKTNPFVATQNDDKIFGRGTADMKGFLAVVLALIPEFKKMDLRIPIHFAFSFDEEVGCQGIPLLINTIQQLNLKPDLCIVGEPTEMSLMVAHKGFQSFRCLLQGLAGHSSLTPHGCNAIEYAAKIVCYLHAYAEQLRTTGLQDVCYDVPFTTLSTNVIHGGIAHNVIPDKCELIFDLRNLPEINPDSIVIEIKAYIDKLQGAMQQQYAAAQIILEELHQLPSFNSTFNLAKLSKVVLNNECQESKKVSYGTEAGYFEQAGIKTIVCGPGSIKQAHQANEFITMKQLEKCAEFLRCQVLAINN